MRASGGCAHEQTRAIDEPRVGGALERRPAIVGAVDIDIDYDNARCRSGREADVRIRYARPPRGNLFRVAARVEEPSAGQRTFPLDQAREHGHASRRETPHRQRQAR